MLKRLLGSDERVLVSFGPQSPKPKALNPQLQVLNLPGALNAKPVWHATFGVPAGFRGLGFRSSGFRAPAPPRRAEWPAPDQIPESGTRDRRVAGRGFLVSVLNIRV